MLGQVVDVIRQAAQANAAEAPALRRVAALVAMEFANEWLWKDANQTGIMFHEIGVLTRGELEALQLEINACAVRGRERAQRLDLALQERAAMMGERR